MSRRYRSRGLCQSTGLLVLFFLENLSGQLQNVQGIAADPVIYVDGVEVTVASSLVVSGPIHRKSARSYRTNCLRRSALTMSSRTRSPAVHSVVPRAFPLRCPRPRTATNYVGQYEPGLGGRRVSSPLPAR